MSIMSDMPEMLKHPAARQNFQKDPRLNLCKSTKVLDRSFLSESFGNVIKGNSQTIVINGKPNRKAMGHAMLSEKDLLEEARLNGAVAELKTFNWQRWKEMAKSVLCRRIETIGHQ